jgi:hypothetical protein
VHGAAPAGTRGTTAATPGSAASPCPTTAASTPSAWSTTGTAWPFPASDTAEQAATTRRRHARAIGVSHSVGLSHFTRDFSLDKVADCLDQAGLPGRVPDRRERTLPPDRCRRLAGDPLADVRDEPEGVRAVRRRGGYAVHVPGGRRRHRRVLGEERLAARCRRALRRVVAPRDHVPQGAQARAHGLPVSHAADWVSADAA